MLRYLLRSLLLALLVCLTVLVISFALARLGGNLAINLAGPDASAETIARIDHQLGLDRPLPVQFLDWANRAAHGDFGESFLFHEKVSSLIATHFPTTFTLGVLAIAIAIAVALPLGILAALHEGGPADVAIGMVALAGQAVPSFWLGLMLIIWFGVTLHWLPISGVDTWTGYIMPALVLSFVAIPAMLRLTRSGMVDAMRADYVRTARAKGLSRAAIVLKHAFRNAAMPVVAVSAVQLGFILGGSVVVEVVFNIRGIGYLAWESIQKGDFPVVQAVVLLFALLFVVLTTLVRPAGRRARPEAADGMMLRRVARRLPLWFGVLIVGVAALIAIFAPLLTPYDPFVQHLSQRFIPPVWMKGGSAAHLLGTDQLGRDYLSRLILGTRISMMIGTTTVLMAGFIGTTLGVLGGYFGGKLDRVVMFIVSCRLAIPLILVALTVVSLIGSSLTVVMLTLGLLLWERFAVVSRAATRQVCGLDFIAAAWAAGCSRATIILREVLPNIVHHLIVIATIDMAIAILLEAALSFLGLGVPPPLPSWGLMIAEAKDYMFFKPWVIEIPGLALLVLVLGINLLGDGLRDVLGAQTDR